MRKLALFEKYGAEEFLKKKVSEESEQIKEIKNTVNATMETLDRYVQNTLYWGLRGFYNS